MLTPEQIAVLPEWAKKVPPAAIGIGEVYRLLAALADANIRIADLERDGYAPEGKVLVSESELRARIEASCRNCPWCEFSRHHNYREAATCDGDLTRGQCRAALLERVGLTPEPDVTPEQDGE